MQDLKALMTDEHPSVSAVASPARLPGPFEAVRLRVHAGDDRAAAYVLGGYAASLACGTEFDLSLAETLSLPSDQALFMQMFEYCLNVGLTVDELLLICNEFKNPMHLF